jgi:hypothetical protein
VQDIVASLSQSAACALSSIDFLPPFLDFPNLIELFVLQNPASWKQAALSVSAEVYAATLPDIIGILCALFLMENGVKRRSKAPRITANPSTLWSSLAMKTGEMMLASAQVINHRTGRIARAGASPNSRDRREFTLMGQEKIAAASESAQAVAARVLNLNQQIGTIAFNQLVTGTAGIVALATARTIAQSGKAQAELMRDTISSSAKTASQLADSVARVAHQGLKPVHSRATANAKRLAKQKK